MTTPIDLLSLVLNLQPLPPDDPTAPLPPWWGRAAHALLLNTLRQYNPALAESLHETQGGDVEPGANPIRPFTCSSLLGRFPQGGLDLKNLYTLRFTALNAETAAILQQAAKDGPLSPGQVVELDYLKFSVVSRQPGEPSQPGAPGAGWAAATSYADLSASLLLARDPAPRRVSLRFASPTTFKSGGKHLPFPLPELVFGSLLERWNAFAPIAFPPEARRYASECLAVSRYKLSSHTVPGKGGGLRIGAVGEVTYTSLNYDRYWMSLVGVLAAFSIFAGVGATTTQGLGQCRLA